MNKEEKELLIKDLCGRLPYGVKVMLKGIHYPVIITIIDAQLGLVYHNEYAYSVENCKLYLRPLESLTREEVRATNKMTMMEIFDYYNSLHVDFRKLIPKGLALPATEDMYK